MEALREKCEMLTNALEKERQLRQEERKGRTRAEKALREQHKLKQITNGHVFDPIGQVKSCFQDRRGTPRQGNLVPDGRAWIQWNHLKVPSTSMDNLIEFSHIWIIFVFHDNTNGMKEQRKAKVAPPR